MVFVGRERELARLAAALQRAVAGRPSRVVLTGTAGAGITHLLDELTARVEALPEVVIVRGASVEAAVGEPYQPLVEGLEATLAGLSDARLRSVIGRSAHDLGGLMPAVGERLDDMGIDRSPPRLVAPDQLGSRVLESLMGLIERLAATGVVLLILEDLHWADPATRAFVGAMLRVRRQLPLCLVLTYRPEDLSRRHPWRPIAAALTADAATELIDLPPLDTDTLERLVTSLQGARPAGDVMAAIQFGSGGNPTGRATHPVGEPVRGRCPAVGLLRGWRRGDAGRAPARRTSRRATPGGSPATVASIDGSGRPPGRPAHHHGRHQGCHRQRPGDGDRRLPVHQP